MITLVLEVNMKSNTKVIDELREFLDRTRCSVTYFAERSNISRRTLHRYLSGEGSPLNGLYTKTITDTISLLEKEFSRKFRKRRNKAS